MKKIPIKNMNLEASILTLQSLLINSKPMAKTDFNKKFKFLNSMLLNSKFIFKNLDSLLKKLSRVSKVKELWNHLSGKENLQLFKEILNFKKKNLQYKKDNQ